MTIDKCKAAAPKVAGHTPKPWAYNPDSGLLFSHINGRLRQVVASLNPFGQGVDRFRFERNAQLIAAAPDLLDALQALIKWHENPDTPDECWMDARNAIAKATEEER